MNIKVIHHQTNSWVVNQNSGTFIEQSQKLEVKSKDTTHWLAEHL